MCGVSGRRQSGGSRSWSRASVDASVPVRRPTEHRSTATATSSRSRTPAPSAPVGSVCPTLPGYFSSPRSIVISASVCLSVRLFVRLSACQISTNTRPYFTKRSVPVTFGRGSVLLRRQCTSGFVDDVMFSYNRANGRNRR